MNQRPTIYALSSGQGRAGIAVLRISGEQARVVVEKLAGVLPAPRFAALCKIKSYDGLEVLDKGLVLWFPAPVTVTGEDIAEFHVHGSPAIVSRLFAEFGNFDGLCPAQPGEFTRRAFENGRLDLVEVEGLADLLSAETDAQRRLAMRQFMGEASAAYEVWRGILLRSLAMLEAAIDFVDEDDVVVDAWKAVKPDVQNLQFELQAALLSSAKAGAVRDGLRLVIAGPPNVGKSSLLNWMVGRQAAIVSPIAGTTRDVIEVPIDFHGVALVIADTAGLRADTSDSIETIGMALAQSEIRDADILLWLIAADVVSEVGPARKPDLIVFNKVDLLDQVSIQQRNESQIHVSLKNQIGLIQLEECLKSLIQGRTALASNAIVVRNRHVNAVKETIRLLNDSLEDDGRPIELIAEDLRKAGQALASITGRIGVEDLLGKIFSEFCIGK